MMIVILLEIANFMFDVQSVVLAIRSFSRVQFLFDVDTKVELDRLRTSTNEDIEELVFPAEKYNEDTAMYLLDQMARYYRFLETDVFEIRENTEIIEKIYTENGKQLSCLILKRRSTEELIILFKGTKSAFELQKDFDYVSTPLPKEWSNVDSEISVHRGFLDLYIPIRDRILSVVDNFLFSNVYVCGHSLGGALTNICLFDLSLHRSHKLYGLTIGAPRTGNITFATWMNDHIRLDQLQNEADIVHSFPTSWIVSMSLYQNRVLYNYMHAGKIYVFHSIGGSLGDAHCLSTYIRHSQLTELYRFDKCITRHDNS